MKTNQRRLGLSYGGGGVKSPVRRPTLLSVDCTVSSAYGTAQLGNTERVAIS